MNILCKIGFHKYKTELQVIAKNNCINTCNYVEKCKRCGKKGNEGATFYWINFYQEKNEHK